MNEKKRILVIDDDQECIEFAKLVLTADGFDVITAMDGVEGVEKASTERPDLIVLDVVMPEQDGWDTCDKLKSSPVTGNIPIVYLTCVKGPKTLYAPHGAFETVWDEYLSKPVTRKELVATVRKLLEQSAAAH